MLALWRRCRVDLHQRRASPMPYAVEVRIRMEDSRGLGPTLTAIASLIRAARTCGFAAGARALAESGDRGWQAH